MTTDTDQAASQAGAAPQSPQEQTIGRLVADASRDISSLIQSEIALAKSEIKVSVKNGGIGAVLFAAAAFLLVLGIVIASVSFALFLGWTGLDLAWCFLIIFGVYAVLALLLALIGVAKVKRVSGPKHAVAQAKQTKQVLSKKK